MTQLYVAAPGGHRAKRRRTIAHNCQITYQEQGEAVTDVDAVGAPSLVLQCTAATTAAVVGKPADPCGIQPDVMPSAPYYAFLTATDSHSVNKLVSKWISASVDSKNKYVYASAGDSAKPLPPARPLPLADTPASMPRSSDDPCPQHGSPPNPRC